MSATWRVVETNDLGIRVGNGIAEIASLVSALAKDAYLRLGAYRARRRARQWIGHLDDHLLNDIGLRHGKGDGVGGLADALMQMSARRSHF